ncbi:MAG: MATE family efflux transporter [Prevotella sp.]|jgi:putative MATE family efflux protein
MMQQKDAIDFGKEKISRLFFKLLFPTFIGLLFSAMFNLIDGIFVGRGVGTDALASVNVTAPVFMICTACSLLFGSGVSVVAAIHLSHRNIKAARINVTQSFLVGVTFGLLVLLVGFLFPEFTARVFGGSEELMPLVKGYLYSILPGLPFCIIMTIGLFVLRLDGSPRIAMTADIVAALLNIFLDWLFVFPLHMGIVGAGVASTISMFVGSLVVIWYMFFPCRSVRLYRLKLSRKSLQLTLRNIGYMARAGMSSALGELAISCLMVVGNHQFMSMLHEDGVAAFSVACYLLPLVFMAGNAIAQSALPILSYNYGLHDAQRVRRTLILSVSIAVLSGLFLSAAGIFGSNLIVTMFIEPGQPAFYIAADGFKWFATGFCFLSANIVLIGYYQSIEKSGIATFFMLLRGFILPIPIFYLLPLIINTRGLWLAVPVSELLTLIIIIARSLSKAENN